MPASGWMGPRGFGKLCESTLKHVLWLLIAVATGGAWIFYFADAPTLAREFFTFRHHLWPIITVALLTATTYVLGRLHA